MTHASANASPAATSGHLHLPDGRARQQRASASLGAAEKRATTGRQDAGSRDRTSTCTSVAKDVMDMKVTELKEELAARDEPVSGNKTRLRRRDEGGE